MSTNNKEQILRTGVTPLWGLRSGTAEKGKAVAMLIASANVSTEISSADQVDSEGRKCGYVCYDCWQSISISGNIIYDSETDNFETVSNLLCVGAAVTDTNAKALLDSVRTTRLNGTEADGNGTYIVTAFDVS